LSMTSNLPCRVEVPVGLGTQELLKHAAWDTPSLSHHGHRKDVIGV
jgi:hypothetical protein